MGFKFDQPTDLDPQELLNEESSRRTAPDRDFRRVADESAIAVEAGDQQMLGLIRTLFFSRAATTPQQVTFCGVDRNGGSSAVCARAAEMLAMHTQLPVCLVD